MLANQRLQLGFETEHSKEQCREILDHYVMQGGDRGVTQRFMRHACGLKQVSAATAPGDAVPAAEGLLHIPSQEADPVQEESKVLRNVEIKYIKAMLAEDKRCISSTDVRCWSIKKPYAHDEMWEKLKSLPTWRDAHTGRKGNMTLAPVFPSAFAMDSILMPVDKFQGVTAKECFETVASDEVDPMDLVLDMMDHCANYLQKKSQAVPKDAKQSSSTSRAAPGEKKEWNEKYRSLAQARKAITQIRNQEPLVKSRRLKRHVSKSQAEAEHKVQRRSFDTEYQPTDATARGRLYLTGMGAQAMPAWLQEVLSGTSRWSIADMRCTH